MSGAMFPTYNNGRVIGEINWLEPICIISELSSYPTATSKNIIIPINREDINEFYIVWGANNQTDKIVTAKNIGIKNAYSSIKNPSQNDIVGYIKKADLGGSLYIISDGVECYHISIYLISEQANSFVIKVQISFSTITSCYAAGKVILGWR